MSSASWDLVQQLAQEFFNVQQQNCSLRLSERNWIEIVDCVLKAHNMTVIYTKDGKEMVTPDHLLHEIKMYLDLHEGRASFSDMQDGLCVDYAVIEERCTELVRRCGTSAKDSEVLSGRVDDSTQWRCWRILDQIVTNEYCDRLSSDIASELEQSGRIAVGSLATKYELPAEFIRKLLPSTSGSKSIMDGDIVYSDAFIRRATSRLVGFLSAVVRPQKVSAFAQQTGLPERLLTSVMDDAINSGRLAGSVQQRMFVPRVFSEAQRECIKSALAAVYVDASVLRRLGVVGDVTEVIKKEWSPLNDEPVAIGSSGYIRKSAMNRLGAAVEEACKSNSEKEIKEGAGWLDTHAAIAALGAPDGSIPVDIVEQLMKNHGRLMEMIDCSAVSEKQMPKGGKGVADSDSDGIDSSGDDQDNKENEEECGLVAVAPWVVEKCSDFLYHLTVTKINEKKQAAMATPAAPLVLTPQVESATNMGSDSAVTSESASVAESVGTPSGTQGKRGKQAKLQPTDQKKKGSATPSVAASAIPKLYRVSSNRLTSLLRKNRESVLAPDFPNGAFKPFVCQFIHAIVSKRLSELAAMTPKSNAAATASSAKLTQQAAAASAGSPASSANIQTELPKLVLTLTSCWRGVTQHLLTGTGNTIDRDRKAVAAHLRETLSVRIIELLRSLPLGGKEPGSGGHSAELLSESIVAFEKSFGNNDVDGAIESLKSLFGLPFARNALNTFGISANALASVLATAAAAPPAISSANRNKGAKEKSAGAGSIGVTVEQLREERRAAGILKLRTMLDDSEQASDPLLLPNVLLIVASLAFERLTGELISCPGRLVPTLVTFLTSNKNLEADSARLFSKALTASQKQLRAGSSPTPAPAATEQKEMLEELYSLAEKAK